MICLVGAGGHAKAVVEAIQAGPYDLAGYADPREAPWLTVARLLDADISARRLAVALGVGGLVPAQLRRRLALLDGYLAAGLEAPPVIHPHAVVSPTARIGAGATVLAGAIVQPGAVIGRGAIVNTGAVVEHDSSIGDGAHLAPRAVVLADCAIGGCSMVGAGAVVLRGLVVPPNTLVRAVTLYRGQHRKTEART
jgi:sugar O-acyltransferase (sialic acid O-acetyltransferase NeuD family)